MTAQKTSALTIQPAFDCFEQTLKDGKSQIAYLWTPADLETPVSAYLKLCGDTTHSFLLESVEGGVTLGRYSAIGFAPDLIWSYKTADQKNAIAELRDLLAQSRIDQVDASLPPMAASGLFGYMGYDCIRLIEDIPETNPDTLNIPDSIMIRPTVMVIFDNVKNMMCIALPIREKTGDARMIYAAAQEKINDILERLSAPVPKQELSSCLTTPLAVQRNMTEGDFHTMVKKAIDYINAGEIFQAVLSQRFTASYDLPPFTLYRSLRRLNPSPFLFFMQFDGFALVGSSPEILVRCRKGTVTIRPIAGTRKRGQDAIEDQALADDLLNDPKERAEHLMLLDLGRNDVGRVADIDSVQVTSQFVIENYSHVMHIVSNVEGHLKKGMDALDALFAGFPAGTVSGAPKVRAMEIIEELEPERRSFYAGCVGYLDANGDMDTCIALRTALVKGGKLYAQAGGGVVADSTPDGEYQESVNKSRAVIAAAEEAIRTYQSKQ